MQSTGFPTTDVLYWPSDPLSNPILVDLPLNGLRLRFDGCEQKLRLIEVLDFTKTQFTYDGKDIVKASEPRGDGSSTGPSFRYVYDKLLGPSFPGQYVAPRDTSAAGKGTYVLSYPGIAFTFPIAKSTWNPDDNFVSILSSSSAKPASSMAIFSGTSWQEACHDLYDRPSSVSKPVVSSRSKDHLADEVEVVHTTCDGKVRFLRRTNSPFDIVLGETTPQDLVAELGPPDTIYAKSDKRLSIHKTSKDDAEQDRMQQHTGQLTKYEEVLDTDHSSTYTTTDDSEDDSPSGRDPAEHSNRPIEYFYNYFHQGFDVFITNASTSIPGGRRFVPDPRSARRESSRKLVVTKVLLHGNVPGSYPFNRYRRCRWKVDPSPADSDSAQVNSETPFAKISTIFLELLKDSLGKDADIRRYRQGMPINRDWDSPGSSCELLGGWEEQSDAQERQVRFKSNSGYGSTELFGFPGLIFEVLKNDTVSCLTIY